MDLILEILVQIGVVLGRGKMTLSYIKDENNEYSFKFTLEEYNKGTTTVRNKQEITIKDTEFNNVSASEKNTRQNTFGFFSDHFGSEHGHNCSDVGKFNLDEVRMSFTRI